MDAEPVRLTVDGQLFEVRARPDEPGTHDFVWRSGPNDGYGFTQQSSDRRVLTQADMERAIRSFLKQVDPATGHIE